MAADDWRTAVGEQAKDIADAKQTIHDVKHDLANHQQAMGYKLELLGNALEAKHDALAKNFTELRNALKWGLGLIVSVVMSFMGWAVLQQYNANESQKKDMAQQIELLKAQEASRVQYRATVLSRLPSTGAAETAGTPEGLAQH